jgi:hypothetical protein
MGEAITGEIGNVHPKEHLSKEKRQKVEQLSRLSVALTRRKSDEVVSTLLPELATKLCDQGLNTSDLMSISRAYFGNKALIVGSLNSQSFFGEEATEGKTIFQIKPPQSALGLRQVFVTSNDIFYHPEWGSLPVKAFNTVQELNRFVGQVGATSESQIRVGILKFYLILAELHLPADGSGRFIGDVDTMIQLAVQNKLSQRKRKFEVIPISNTGYRVGNLERVMSSAQRFFEGVLIDEIFREIVADHKDMFPQLRNFIRANNESSARFTNAPAVVKKLRQAFTLICSDSTLENLYYQKLDQKLNRLIKTVNDPNQKFHAVASGIWGRVRGFTKDSQRQYADSNRLKEQGVNVGLFDQLVGIERYLDSGLLKGDLAGSLVRIQASDIVEDTTPVLKHLLQSLKRKDKGLFNWALSRSDNLKNFAIQNGLFGLGDVVLNLIGRRRKRVIS